MSFTIIIAFFLGLVTGILGILGFCAYHYYKAWQEAHDEGWDLPS